MVVAKLFRSSSVAFVAHCYFCPVVVYVDDGLCFFCGLLFFDRVPRRGVPRMGQNVFRRRRLSSCEDGETTSMTSTVFHQKQHKQPSTIRRSAAQNKSRAVHARPHYVPPGGKAFLVPYPGPRHAVLGQKNTSTTTDITGHFYSAARSFKPENF